MPDSQLAAATPSATRCHDCGTDVSRWWVDIDGAGLTTVCVSCAHASHIAAHYPCPHGQIWRYVYTHTAHRTKGQVCAGFGDGVHAGWFECVDIGCFPRHGEGGVVQLGAKDGRTIVHRTVRQWRRNRQPHDQSS